MFSVLPGEYIIDVYFYGKPIKGSPFRVQAYDLSSIHVTIPSNGMVDRLVEFDSKLTIFHPNKTSGSVNFLALHGRRSSYGLRIRSYGLRIRSSYGLMIRSYGLRIRSYGLRIRSSYGLMIRSCGLMIRSYGLMIRSYGLMIRSYGLMIRSYGLMIRSYGLRIRSYGLRIRSSYGLRIRL